jgi:hypothetical protein
MVDIAKHSIHSSYREMVLEHLFVGEVMRHCWRRGLQHIEMLKSQVDNSGYDIVLETNEIMRHIQLKASHAGAKTAGVNINLQLATKSSGCIVWMFFDPSTLEFSHFLWFGEGPGKRLASLDDFKVGKHSKGNAQGVKADRPNTRYLTRSAFIRLNSIAAVVDKLFGEPISTFAEPADICIPGVE